MNCASWKIAFTLPDVLDTPGVSATFDGKTVRVALYSDIYPDPLILQCAAAAGDRIALHMYPYRAELYRGDVLTDEEWPVGRIDVPDGAVPLADAPQPDPDRTPFCAEGWHPAPDIFVGDCMPFVDGDDFHVFYLKDRHHHRSKWRLGAHQWAHIVSRDLVHWTQLPMAVEIDRAWEGSICTGSVIRDGGQYSAWYAVRMALQFSPARITCSVSDDGVHFRKTDERITLPDSFDGPSARDPFVYRGADGTMRMLVTTSKFTPSGSVGCLAMLRRTDNGWVCDPTPMLTAEDQPECSDLVAFGGRYYLIYSIAGTARYGFGPTESGPWTFPDGGVIRADGLSPLRVPKSAVWHGRLFFVGFTACGGYGGTMHFYEAFPQPDGTLRFELPAEFAGR